MTTQGNGFFITGTDTGVGKTVITAGLLGALRRRGVDAAAIKPVQSGGILRNKQLISEDAVFYSLVSNLSYDQRQLNPICLEPPLAPGIAAVEAGVSIKLDTMIDHYHWMSGRHRLILVEGAGGLLVPLVGHKVTVADLALRIGLPLLVVARPALGTINHTSLTVAYARSIGLEVAGIVINGYNHHSPGRAEQTNPAAIEAMTGVPVLGLIPPVDGLRVEGEKPNPGDLVTVIEKYLDIDRLLVGKSR